MPRFARVNACTVTIALVAILSVGDAEAVSQVRSLASNPVGLCQAALPAFEGQLRKRPLAVQNEGRSDSFVTCAFSLQTAPRNLQVWVASSNGVEHEISCTAVTGFNLVGGNQYVTKSTTVPATGLQRPLSWNPGDFSGSAETLPSTLISLSCRLVPGAAINDSYVQFAEDVGA